MQRIEFADRLYRHSGRKVVLLPDRCVVFESRTYNLKNANPPTDACQIAKQYIARLQSLYRLPSGLTESRNTSPGGQELLPGLEREKIKPISGRQLAVA